MASRVGKPTRCLTARLLAAAGTQCPAHAVNMMHVQTDCPVHLRSRQAPPLAWHPQRGTGARLRLGPAAAAAAPPACRCLTCWRWRGVYAKMWVEGGEPLPARVLMAWLPRVPRVPRCPCQAAAAAQRSGAILLARHRCPRPSRALVTVAGIIRPVTTAGLEPWARAKRGSRPSRCSKPLLQ